MMAIFAHLNGCLRFSDRMQGYVQKNSYIIRVIHLCKPEYLRSNQMAHAIKRIVLTPSQAAEKSQIVEQIRVNPIGPWVNGKKLNLPKIKDTSSRGKKKN
jgi:hypothetical protein